MNVVTVEITPNPNAKKFILDQPIANGERGSFFNAAQAGENPLAEALFAIEGIAGVMWLGDFLTVTKTSEASWAKITPAVKKLLKKNPA